MIVECVAGQDHDIGANLPRHIEDAAQPGRAVAAMHRRDAVVVDVQVGGMDEENIAAGGNVVHSRYSPGGTRRATRPMRRSELIGRAIGGVRTVVGRQAFGELRDPTKFQKAEPRM